jgi:hypothetical protein
VGRPTPMRIEGLNPSSFAGCVVSWSLRFAEPIVLEDGAKLATLRQAIAHPVKTIPAAERGSPAVLSAGRTSDKRGHTVNCHARRGRS